MGKENSLTAFVIAIAALLLYGSIAESSDGSGGSTHLPASGTAPASASASGAVETAASCTMSALRVTASPAVTGPAAGSLFVPLEFRNISAGGCTLPAYPAVAFAGGPKGPMIGPAAVRQDPGAAKAVGLPPGSVAHAWLRVPAIADYPASRCHPVIAGGLSVSLGETGAADFVWYPLSVCGQSPAAGAGLGVFPVQAGEATRGTVP